ncbi:MAG: M24 family metallopeptidase [Spirochaetia bacterium]
MLDLEKSRAAIREGGFSGWLLHNVFHRDEIADLILDVPRERTNTRPWVCVLPSDGLPRKIVHRIEASILAHVPGETTAYSTRAEFAQALSRALSRGGTIAADYSPTIPVGSFLDHGTALLLQSLGAALAPAEGLVARYLGALDDEGRRSHGAAAKTLCGSVAGAWDRLSRELRGGRSVTEGDVRDWLTGSIASAGLVSDSPPIVGAGRHTADPHFSVEGRGAALEQGDLVQFDIWAKETSPGAVYADIAWVGVCAPAPSPLQQRMFEAVREAREAAVSLLQRRLAAGTPVSGADVDRAAREVLADRGFAAGIKHRTGHSIGARVHGYGVNLDSVEFPDDRALTEGACFSVEPGIYLEELGMRTEIDCLIHGGALAVTGTGRQLALLTLG